MSIKRAAVDGFSRENMPKRLANIKRYGADWRRVGMKKMVMTILHQEFHHTSGESVLIKHICPWGMREVMSKLLSEERCKNKNVLPNKLKEELPELMVSYNKVEWTILISNTGPQTPTDYHWLYCLHCTTQLIPKVLEYYKDKLCDGATVVTLINNWDALKIPGKYIDYVGCFLPWEPTVNAGPNSRKYIRDQAEHPKVSHIYTVSSKVTANKMKRQSKFSSAPSSKVIVLDAPQPGSSGQSTIVTKFTEKHLKQDDLKSFLGVIPLIGECTGKSQINAKGFCLSIVLQGVNKAISQETIIDMYKAGYEGQLIQYEDSMAYLKEKHPAAKIPPVIKVQLNNHNIVKAERAILDAYRYDEKDSVYKEFEQSPFYSLMHDGISKFGNEMNGVFLRGIKADNDPLSLPYCLTKMKGGVTGMDTALEVINNVASIISEKNSAFHEVPRRLEEENSDTPNYIPPSPPNYFKLGTLVAIDHVEKTICIQVNDRYPVANIGDGVAVNNKAARILRELFGFMSPAFRCSAHAADGTLKRLTKSKTMNVAEVTQLYECLRTVIKHFEQSIKNKETLDLSMEILGMTPLHLLSWCQTRMAHFLKSCNVFDEMLPPVYDTMYTRGVRVDERDLLFTAMNIYIIKIMSDLYPKFDNFLRQADKTDLLVSMAYNLSDSFAKSMESLETPSADKFFASLKFDTNGNLLATSVCAGNKHTIMLNHPHKPSRNITEDERLEKVKSDLISVREKIVTNIIENVNDQCNEESYYYCWSGLDLALKLSVTQRKDRLRDLIGLFCNTKIQTVQKYKNKSENETVPDSWEGYEVTLRYPPKINVPEKELYDEFDGAFKIINGLYMAEVNHAKMQKRQPNQLEVWKQFLSEHFLEFPSFGQLVQIMLATSGNTSPVERGYTYFEMIAQKRRNHLKPENLETLFLLATLKIPSKKPNMYANEVNRLNSSA